jgi:hypothetical protein
MRVGVGRGVTPGGVEVSVRGAGDCVGKGLAGGAAHEARNNKDNERASSFFMVVTSLEITLHICLRVPPSFLATNMRIL